MKGHRFDVLLITLDPARGSEMQKTRPCIVVSPDEANAHLNTAVTIPITSTLRNYPSRIDIRFRGRDGQAAIDQIRVVDQSRLIRKLGRVDPDTALRLSEALRDYFA